MNRLNRLFQQQKKDILSIYFTAGYPQLEATIDILETLQQSGVDLVEIGMPYSDPLADGPVIQASSQQALKNGMTLSTLFEQLENCRQKIKLPIVLMGYLNPVLQYGFERFLQDCNEVGVDGLILPDLPLEEYKATYKTMFKKYGMANIMLVTPETTPARLQQIDQASTGFVYAVSSSSTTGTAKNWSRQETYFKRLKASRLNNPILTGFGVSDKPTFKAASAYTNGAIIGTAFIKTLQAEGNRHKNIQNFITKIKN